MKQRFDLLRLSALAVACIVAPVAAMAATAFPAPTAGAAAATPVSAATEAPRARSAVAPSSEGSAIVLANDRLRIEFRAAAGAVLPAPEISLKRNGSWTRVDSDASAEGYLVIACPPDLERRLNVGHELYNRTHHGEWQRKGRRERITSILETGVQHVFRPSGARIDGNAVVLDFPASDIGRLEARWELEEGLAAPRVSLRFTPEKSGDYSLGYRLFWKRDMEQVAEVLMPTLFLRRGLPQEPVTLLDPYMSTPIAAVQPRAAGASPVTVGLAGDPTEIPRHWPDGHRPRFGMMLRQTDGSVQPVIAGPVPGTDAARTEAGHALEFRLRIVVADGDWYAAYRMVADALFGLRDYRRNWNVSLTEAVHNMIDLVKDDKFGGWWPLGKGFNQIESRNTVSQAAPAALLSVYRLTGDEDFWERRARPTLEYCLSRRYFHFSPVQLNQGAGGYLRENEIADSMRGPVHGFAPTAFGALWALSNGRIKALGDLSQPGRFRGNSVSEKWIAWNPDDNRAVPLDSGGGAAADRLDAWLSHYAVTGADASLQQAKRAADLHIEQDILKAPTKYRTGFWHVRLPDWEGLLWLYELTGEKRYLDAAAFGARQLMVGIWTQPTLLDDNAPVAVNGEQYRERHDALWLWRGDDRQRLGYGASTGNLPRLPPSHTAPAWLASNIGLGYEGEGSLNDPRAPLARYIFQSVWAPGFLKLALATGDETFAVYARNAVVGRFANYPGYYLHGPVTLQNDPNYPRKGPDFTYLYHHHIPPHLGWCIDYLVSEARLLSGGGIAFPSLRQAGYAFFDFRVYGHAPGRIFADKEVWLWFDRKVASVDHPQLNHIAAHDDGRFYVVLMNQDRTAAAGEVRANPALLGVPDLQGKRVTILDASGRLLSETTCSGDRLAKLEVPGRGLRVVVVHGVTPKVSTHRVALPERASSGVVSIATNCPQAGKGKIPVRAHGAPLQALPGKWSAYVWLDACREQVKWAVLRYSVDGGATFKELRTNTYPYEFTVTDLDAQRLEFEVVGRDWDGQPFNTTGRGALTPAQ